MIVKKSTEFDRIGEALIWRFQRLFENEQALEDRSWTGRKVWIIGMVYKKDKENHKESWGHSVGAHVKLKHNYWKDK